ncbi:MAG: hypothetical protein AB7O96_15540 [Pseudobdellovibrionaceae bacterium]
MMKYLTVLMFSVLTATIAWADYGGPDSTPEPYDPGGGDTSSDGVWFNCGAISGKEVSFTRDLVLVLKSKNGVQKLQTRSVSSSFFGTDYRTADGRYTLKARISRTRIVDSKGRTISKCGGGNGGGASGRDAGGGYGSDFP